MEIIKNVIISLISGGASAILIYWLNNRKQDYNNKVELLKILLRYRNNLAFSEKEFNDSFLTIDVLFYKDKKIIELFNKLYPDIFYITKGNKDEILSIYEKMLGLITEKLKYGKINYKFPNFEEIAEKDLITLNQENNN